MLNLPELGASIEYLESLGDATVDLRMTRLREPGADVGQLREAVAATDVVAHAFSMQRSDGSWGGKDHPGKRLLPTLWMVKTLGELGLDASHDGWRRAVAFMELVGHTNDGVFSIWGSRDGVLSCYVGLAANIYLDGGLVELALPQIDWILRYQEIRAAGQDLRDRPVPEWAPYLKTKYGGCMAETTCLVGLLREGRSLAKWGGEEGRPLVAAIRRAFLERRVMFRANGSIIPLAVTPKVAESWLEPSFPLDWRVDLIEVLGFLANTGPADSRLQEAVDRLAGYQLPNGTWPLRRSYRPDQLPGLERRTATKSSPIITVRVVEALWPLVAASTAPL